MEGVEQLRAELSNIVRAATAIAAYRTHDARSKARKLLPWEIDLAYGDAPVPNNGSWPDVLRQSRNAVAFYSAASQRAVDALRQLPRIPLDDIAPDWRFKTRRAIVELDERVSQVDLTLYF